MKVEVFDERLCALGEGPFADGATNDEISWVDITKKRVLTRNFATGTTDQFLTSENVGFAIPRAAGGYVLGTNSGPIFRDAIGGIHPFLSLLEIEPLAAGMQIRWNDAKVSPSGNLWLGTMGMEMLPGTSSLFKYDVQAGHIERALTNLTISNGMDWSDDGGVFYFVDSKWQAVHAFDVVGDKLFNERVVVEIPESEGAPDGMCMDSEGGIWIALWGGSQIRRYDTEANFKLDQVIKMPTPLVTSCAFAGENLDTLIVTSAHNDEPDPPAQAGMTFCVMPGVTGRKSRTFNL